MLVLIDRAKAAASAGSDMESEVLMLKAALDTLGLEPVGDFFDILQEGDVIEIHNADGVQLYRNFEAFTYCSFTLSELLTRGWHELYLRPQKVIEAIQNQVAEVIEKQLAYVAVKTSRHIVTEAKTKFCYTLELNFKYIAPLRDKVTGECTAVMTSKTARILAAGQPLENVAFL